MGFMDVFRASVVNLDTAAAQVEKLLCGFGSSSGGITSKTADATYSNLTTVTVSVSTGESVLLVGQAMLSHSNALYEVGIQLAESSSRLGSPGGIITNVSSANGNEGTVNLLHILTPTAGNHTYQLQYIGTGGAGKTVYANYWSLYWLKFRTS